MKITQNSENGQILLYLKQDETYDIEEHLDALMEFTTEQAVIVFTLKSSYNKILQQLEQLQNKVNELTGEDKL